MITLQIYGKWTDYFNFMTLGSEYGHWNVNWQRISYSGKLWVDSQRLLVKGEQIKGKQQWVVRPHIQTTANELPFNLDTRTTAVSLIRRLRLLPILSKERGREKTESLYGEFDTVTQILTLQRLLHHVKGVYIMRPTCRQVLHSSTEIIQCNSVEWPEKDKIMRGK